MSQWRRGVLWNSTRRCSGYEIGDVDHSITVLKTGEPERSAI